MALDHPLEKIEEKHLQELVALRIPESQTIEFKTEYDWNVPKSKAEFLKDVSAMANADGGDIILGMQEDADAQAKELFAIKESDPQSLEQRITAYCNKHLNPSLVGVGMRCVSLNAGGYAFVIRVPQSWSAPHMVSLDDDNRFYIRRVRENLRMTVEELRRRFLLADTVQQRMRSFRTDRVGHFFENLRGYPISAGQSTLLFHFLPLHSFSGQSEFDLVPLFEDNICLSPTGGKLEWTQNYNFDGIRVVEHHGGKSSRSTQIYRNGVIEIEMKEVVARVPVDNEQRMAIIAPAFEKHVLERTAYGLRLLQKLGVQPPVFVAVSFIGVQGLFLMYCGNEGPSGPVERQKLDFEEVMFESLDDPLNDRLNPFFNILAQSFGLPKWL